MATPKHRRFLRLPQVLEKTGLSRASVYAGAVAGWFPKRVKINERASGWVEDEVEAWLAARVAERDASPVPPTNTPTRRARARPSTRKAPRRAPQKKREAAAAAP